jgi:phage gp46-like protein
MPIDLKLTLTDAGYYDISIGADGDFETIESYDTAVIVSVFTDRRASPEEMMHPERRRGWAGNEHTPGVEMGSKLWLFEQPRATRSVANAVADALRDALQWFVDERRAVAVSASATFTLAALEAEAVIEYSASEVDRHHFTLWRNTGA